jgi:hypothetical protein
MSQNLLIPNKYAIHINESRQAVSKAIKLGLIKTVMYRGKKHIDPDDPVNRDWAISLKDKKAGQSFSSKKASKKKAGPGTVGPPGGENPLVQQPAGDIDGIPPEIIQMIEAGALTITAALQLPKAWVDKLKSYEQMKSIKQNREERRHELVNIKLIKNTLGRVYEIHRTQFLTLNTKIVPGLAGAMSETITITPEMVGKKIDMFTGNKPESMTEADRIIDEACFTILKNIKGELNKFFKLVKDEPLSD